MEFLKSRVLLLEYVMISGYFYLKPTFSLIAHYLIFQTTRRTQKNYEKESEKSALAGTHTEKNGKTNPNNAQL